MPPDEPNDEERLEQLPEDGETPFRPAGPNPADATGDAVTRGNRAKQPGSTYPQGDANVQEEEMYDAGEAAGMGVPEEPNAGNAVVDYHPDQDQRRGNVAKRERSA